MKKLLLLALITSVHAQDSSFNGTVYDLDTGRIQVINGNFEKPKETLLQKYRRMNDKLDESNARLSAEIAANQQLYQLREQTHLLRKIANQ